jgi:hypothetical protein
MHKIATLAAVGIVALGALSASDAEARNGRRGAALAVGAVGLAAGAIIAGAASQAYAAPGYGYAAPSYDPPVSVVATVMPHRSVRTATMMATTLRLLIGSGGLSATTRNRARSTAPVGWFGAMTTGMLLRAPAR